MAKHRQPKNRRISSDGQAVTKRRPSPSLVLAGSTAVALSTVLVFGHATNNTADSPQVQLTAATIGIGGRGDPNAANIPNKLQGNVVPFGVPPVNYIPVVYPAGFDIDNSVNAGVPVLDDAIKTNSGQFLLVVGYSEGTIVAEKVRRNLDPGDPGAPPVQPGEPNTDDPDLNTSNPGLLWVMIASPNVPNGGIFGRFPNLTIPFFVTSNGPAQPSPYDTTYVTNEYDPYADFPAYFNPLSLVNSLFAVVYVHPDQYYDSVDYDPLTGGGTTPVLVKTVTNTLGGADRYVFVPAAHLPLLAPGRQVFGALGLTPLTEPVLGAVEPLLRLLVDMGYTDRQNLNPEVHVPFSLFTPPERILQTAAGVPGAIGQGVTNLVTGLPAPVAPTNSPAINAKSLAQEPSESLVNDEPTIAAATDPAPTQSPSSSGTSPTETPAAATTLSDPGPTLGKVTEDGNKATPTTSSSGTSPTETPAAATTPSDPGPTLGKVTEDGNKATPTTSSPTTAPKKNVLTELADTVKGFFSPKTKPAPSTPTSEPTGSTPSGSTTQDQSEGPTSNAA